jgi:hypothetical protein
MSNRRTFMKRIEMQLSDDDVAKRKDHLVTLVDQETKVQADKSDAMREYNAELKDVRKTMRDTVAAIKIGKEVEEVECYERPLEQRNAVEIVRVSDDKVVDERPMTAEEMQTGLFDGVAPANDGSADPDADEPEDDENAEADAGQKRFPPGKKAPKGKAKQQEAAAQQ